MPFIHLEGEDNIFCFYHLTFLVHFRKRWKINSGICQKEGMVKHKLTLTSCVGGKDFTCDDGTCVRINKVKKPDTFEGICLVFMN